MVAVSRLQGRHGGEDLPDLIQLLLPALELHPGEEIRPFRTQGGRHGAECLLHISCLLSDSDTRFGDKNVIVAGVSRCTQSRRPALLQEEALHALAMVDWGQDPWKQI